MRWVERSCIRVPRTVNASVVKSPKRPHAVSVVSRRGTLKPPRPLSATTTRRPASSEGTRVSDVVAAARIRRVAQCVPRIQRAGGLDRVRRRFRRRRHARAPGCPSAPTAGAPLARRLRRRHALAPRPPATSASHAPHGRRSRQLLAPRATRTVERPRDVKQRARGLPRKQVRVKPGFAPPSPVAHTLSAALGERAERGSSRRDAQIDVLSRACSLPRRRVGGASLRRSVARGALRLARRHRSQRTSPHAAQRAVLGRRAAGPVRGGSDEDRGRRQSRGARVAAAPSLRGRSAFWRGGTGSAIRTRRRSTPASDLGRGANADVLASIVHGRDFVRA